MTRLFRSKSCGLVEFNVAPPSPLFHDVRNEEEDSEEDEEEEEEELDSDEEDDDGDEDVSSNPVSTPFINSGSKVGGGLDNKGWRGHGCQSNQFAILDILVAALKKSLLVTCSVEREDVSSLDISWPTEVRHVSHVTFDRFNGFLGLPSELEPEVPKRVPSARSPFNSLFFSSLLPCLYIFVIN